MALPVTEAPPPRPPRLVKSLVALVLLYAYGVLGAVLAGVPLAEVTRLYYGGHPRGDSPLAAPGALALGDLLLGKGAAALSAALPTSLVLVVLVAIGAHLPFGALVTHLSRQHERGTLREAYAHAAKRFFVLGSATVLSLAARAVVAVLAGLAAEGASSAARGRLDDRAADYVGFGVLVPFAVLLFLVYVVTDLAYVGVVAHDDSLPRAIVIGVRALKKRGKAVLVPAFVSYVVGIGATALVASVVGLFAITAPPAVLFLSHQAALLVKLVARAGWLARAIRPVMPSPVADDEPLSMTAEELAAEEAETKKDARSEETEHDEVAKDLE